MNLIVNDKTWRIKISLTPVIHYCKFMQERQDGDAAGERVYRCATLLPLDFNCTTAGKHTRVCELTWHTPSFYLSWEVNIDRHNDNYLPVVNKMSSRRHNENYSPVVYKMSSRTIPRMSKMCAYRHIFVFWVPAVDDASGRYSLWCSVLNWKINTMSWHPNENCVL